MPVKSIECPRCGASGDDPCTTTAGRPVGRHSSRGPESIPGDTPGSKAGRTPGMKKLPAKSPGSRQKHTGVTDDQVLSLKELRAAAAKCGAKVRPEGADKWEGKRCPNGAGLGTSHVGYGRCSSHGGSSPGGRRHGALLAARAEVEAVRNAQRFFGHPTRADPELVLREEMQRTHGIVKWLGDMLALWGMTDEQAEEIGLTDPAPDWTEDEREEARARRDRYDVPSDHVHDDTIYSGVQDVNPKTGLPDLVAVHSTEKAVGFTDTEYAAWMKVFREERAHLRATAKACIDAGIEERLAQSMQTRSVMMARVMLDMATRNPKGWDGWSEDQIRAELQVSARRIMSVVPDQRVIQA